MQRKGNGSSAEQFANVTATAKQLVRIMRAGNTIALTHGNGPQVGDILLANEIAKDVVAPMPLDVCGAESQGMIGYMIQQSLENELRQAGLDVALVTVVTQTLVDADDPAFSRPTKPIGPFYSLEQAEQLRKEKGWTVVNDSNRGYRRVVPSPDPVSIVEEKVIRRLFDAGTLVIAAGGGGIPVVRLADSGQLRGVEAVIDKDLGAALLARALEVDVLMILTDVDGVMLDFGKSSQRMMSAASAMEARRYLKEGQFPAGNMGPKVEAALRFVEGGGKMAIITALARAEEALDGKAGTTITAD